MHVTCRSRLLEVDIDQTGGLEKFTSLGIHVGRGLELGTKVESVTAERGCSKGPSNDVEALSSTCQASLGSYRASTPQKIDLEKSSSLGMKSAAVSSLKPMLRVSLPKEPVGMALAMAWRSSLALVRQILALGGRVLLGKVTWISYLLLA